MAHVSALSVPGLTSQVTDGKLPKAVCHWWSANGSV